MGMTALPSSDEKGVPGSQQVYVGLTQPVARVRGMRITAIGMGYWRVPNGVGAKSAGEGAVALRATSRMNGVRTWTAIAYGRAGALGALGGSSFTPSAPGIGFDGVHTDTTVSRRVDIGSIARIESGLLGTRHGFDMSMGLAVERATRVTTQTIRIQSFNDLPVATPRLNDAVVRTMRSLQRREVATGLASVGWRTGPTSWLTSVSAPLYAWITSDASLPKPRIPPAIASLAVVQPITAWFSAVGSASTNPTSIGGSALNDDASINRRGIISPVFALGVSIARVPFRNRNGEHNLNGILGFESRVVGMLDAVFVTDSGGASAHDSTYRVQVVIDAPNAVSVELMGDATEWSVTTMSRGGDGRWRSELKLSAGAHRLTVRADGGEWIAPPGLPLGSNDFGSPVGLLVLEPQTRSN